VVIEVYVRYSIAQMESEVFFGLERAVMTHRGFGVGLEESVRIWDIV
jgi:hypothetical protein